MSGYRTLPATRVGVVTVPVHGRRVKIACERCGRRREVQAARPGKTLCRDCRDVVRGTPHEAVWS